MIDIIELLKMSPAALLSYAAGFLSELGGPVYRDDENFVFAPGNGGQILFQAHVDTVRTVYESPTLGEWVKSKKERNKKVPMYAEKGEAEKSPLVIIRKNGIIRTDGSSPLGADDRAGVWITLNLAEKGYPVLLTNYEETGGRGMEAFVEAAISKGYPMDAFRLFVGLDRKQFREFVSYGTESEAVNEWITKTTGYKQESGSFSDVLILSRKLKYPNINLSVGFYHEHRNNEYLVEGAMAETLDACLEIAKAEGMPTDKLREPKPERHEWRRMTQGSLFENNGHDCGECGAFLNEECDPRYQRLCEGIDDTGSADTGLFDASWQECLSCLAKESCLRTGRPICMEEKPSPQNADEEYFDMDGTEDLDCDSCPAYEVCLNGQESICQGKEAFPGTRWVKCYTCDSFMGCAIAGEPQCMDPEKAVELEDCWECNTRKSCFKCAMPECARGFRVAIDNGDWARECLICGKMGNTCFPKNALMPCRWNKEIEKTEETAPEGDGIPEGDELPF